MSRSTVIDMAQSGRTPDVVEYLHRAHARGAFTVAVTNDPGSVLSETAEATLPLEAGPELAVAATRTYVDQLATLALLAGHVGGGGSRIADGNADATDTMEQALPARAAQANALAPPFASVGRIFVIGRGPEFATVRETALELLETCRKTRVAMTATDLAHGPLAVLDPLFPVWTIASHDQTLPAVQEVAARVREFGSTIVAWRISCQLARGRRVPPDHPRTGGAPPFAASFRRARTTVRLCARPHEGLQSRQPEGPDGGDARALSVESSSNLVPHAAVVALCDRLRPLTPGSRLRVGPG